ncbi:MAG: hypothetical protein EBU57_05035 [Alphaproteobacteria bacterium]|nr:hypothetical protein [Alphaproteobacteria bacterium]
MTTSALSIKAEVSHPIVLDPVGCAVGHVEPFALIGYKFESDFACIRNQFERHVQFVSRLGIVANRLEFPLRLAHRFTPAIKVAAQIDTNLTIKQLRIALGSDRKNPAVFQAVVAAIASTILR